MSVWLILLIVAFVLSPLSMLMPSRRQRGRMDVRLQARRTGVAMQLSSEQWPYWLIEEPPGQCPQYYRARSRGRQDCWCYWQIEPGQWLNKWREPCTDAPLVEQLSSLPVDVYKAEATTQMISLCWGERGGEDALGEIASFLQIRA
jgi:hypothetical protein